MLLWVWPAFALALSVAAVAIARHQAAAFRTLVHAHIVDGIVPAVPVVRALQDWLFVLPFGAALLLGVAWCISARWPSRPTKLAVGVFYFALPVLVAVTHY